MSVWFKICNAFCGLALWCSLGGVAVGVATSHSPQSIRGPAMVKYTNHLQNEKSPYLQQHVHNPVDWYPWGDEAFLRAAREDKPIFLSIGYSTCHWCHVMAHESFESQTIAALLNKNFVCIKVDREERPDVDQMYMAATQAMTGSGGWPMSLFLFPDGRPFYAATYIPAASMQGGPAFPDIINAVHKAWQGRRDELEKTATSLIEALEQHQDGPAVLSSDLADQAFAAFSGQYDTRFGGFGRSPKFPRPVVLHFLLQYSFRTSNKHALHMAQATLDHMAAGGIHDQLGGGFHRYSVDRQWRVSHFEKMLYDQAQLLQSYLDMFQITGDQKYSQVARGIADYVLRDMQDRAGGFYSAEDADSADPYKPGAHSEGAFYLWTEKDIVRTLGSENARFFSYCFGIEFEGNALHDPQHEFSGRNILYQAHSAADAAKHFSRSVQEMRASLEKSKSLLLAKRNLRIRPHLDDKIITAWNGLMIGALARAGGLLDEQEYIDAAVKAARFIQKNLFVTDSARLLRRYRDGEAAHAGQLDDYACLVAGLLDLYQVIQNPDLLSWAQSLTKTMLQEFWDEKAGGLFDSVADARVPLRLKSDYDGAEPAANSVAAMNLLRLGRLTARTGWLERSRQTIEAFSGQLNNVPQALPEMLCSLSAVEEKPEQVVIAGIPGRKDTSTLLAEVRKHYHPTRLLLLADQSRNQEFLSRYLLFIQTMNMQGGKATAYVCKNYTCSIPATSAQKLAGQLTTQGKSKK